MHGSRGYSCLARPMSREPHSETLPTIVGFRAAALRRGVFFAWLMVIALLATGIGGLENYERLFVTAGGFVVLLALGTAVNWDDMLKRKIGPWFAWAWAALLTLGLGAAASIPDMFGVTMPLFAGVMVLSGLSLEPVRHAVVAALAVLVIALAGLSVATPQELVSTLTVPLLTVLVVAVATGFFGLEFTREATRSYMRLDELRTQREDFERLYAVTATLAGAESLSDGLPRSSERSASIWTPRSAWCSSITPTITPSRS